MRKVCKRRKICGCRKDDHDHRLITCTRSRENETSSGVRHISERSPNAVAPPGCPMFTTAGVLPECASLRRLRVIGVFEWLFNCEKERNEKKRTVILTFSGQTVPRRLKFAPVYELSVRPVPRYVEVYTAELKYFGTGRGSLMDAECSRRPLTTG